MRLILQLTMAANVDADMASQLGQLMEQGAWTGIKAALEDHGMTTDDMASIEDDFQFYGSSVLMPRDLAQL